MNADRAIAVTPVLVAELHVEGEVMPVCVHVMEAVQSGDLSTVANPGEFVTALAPLPGSRGSGWGIQNICSPRR
jgi:hypothetical protein